MIDLESEYPGQVVAADANYPTGGFKNETTPGVFDGTPFEKAWANDLNALMQSLIAAAGITVSGSADTVVASQLMEALLHQVTAGAFFIDSGAADAYVLSHATNGYAPEAYKDGARYRWVPDNDNTGASTVDIDSIGAKDIKTHRGEDPAAGDIEAGRAITIEYDLANDRFYIYSVATGGAIGEGYILIEDQKTIGVNGGTFEQDDWRRRDLNEEVEDTGNNASISSNQITLAAGTYRVRATAPAFHVGNHQARLYNITDTAVILYGRGGVCLATDDTSSESEIVGRFTIADTKVIEVQHYCTATATTVGFGPDISLFGTEIYTRIEFWKEV